MAYSQPQEMSALENVKEFLATSFTEPITLSCIVRIAGLSVPAFCKYFKKHTQKTFIEYLTELRIDYACLQLRRTPKSVVEICYESGFNSVAHFHRKFLELKKQTPLQFRQHLLGRWSDPIN